MPTVPRARFSLLLVCFFLSGFAALHRLVDELATGLCDGRLALALEGGYDQEVLPHAVLNALRLLDDRDARPGVKFADAELIGIPHRIGIGPKALENGDVEYTPRASGETELVPVGDIAARIVDIVEAAR